MNKFAFIVHPIEIQDFYSRFPVLQRAPIIVKNHLLEALPPFKITIVTGVKTAEKEVEGYFIGVPVSYTHLMEGEGKSLRKVIKACGLAEKLGVELIGIGSYLSHLDGIDHEIVKNYHIPITTGKTFELISMVEGAKKVAASCKLDFKESDIVVLGTECGSGGALSRRIAREAKYVTLVSDERDHLEELSQIILEETGTAVHTTDRGQHSIERGEIIFIVDWKDRSLDWSKLRKNAIICDLSRFRRASNMIKKLRDDVICFDDGLIKLPWAIETKTEHRGELIHNICTSAFAETILLTLKKGSDVLPLRDLPLMDRMDLLKEWAEEYAFELVAIGHMKKEISII